MNFAQRQRLENYNRAIDAETREVTLSEALELPEIKALVDALEICGLMYQKHQSSQREEFWVVSQFENHGR